MQHNFSLPELFAYLKVLNWDSSDRAGKLNFTVQKDVTGVLHAQDTKEKDGCVVTLLHGLTTLTVPVSVIAESMLCEVCFTKRTAHGEKQNHDFQVFVNYCETIIGYYLDYQAAVTTGNLLVRTNEYLKLEGGIISFYDDGDFSQSEYHDHSYEMFQLENVYYSVKAAQEQIVAKKLVELRNQKSKEELATITGTSLDEMVVCLRKNIKPKQSRTVPKLFAAGYTIYQELVSDNTMVLIMPKSLHQFYQKNYSFADPLLSPGVPLERFTDLDVQLLLLTKVWQEGPAQHRYDRFTKIVDGVLATTT